MKGRYYSPRWHRFINSDQGADPYSLNQTAYVGGSPFEATDPMGMEMKVQAQHTWYSVDMYDAEVWAAELEGGGGVREYYARLAEEAVWASIQKRAEESARNAADDSDSDLDTATAELGEIAEILAEMMGEMDAKQLKELKKEIKKECNELYNNWAREQVEQLTLLSQLGLITGAYKAAGREDYPDCIDFAESLAKYINTNMNANIKYFAKAVAEPKWWGAHYHVKIYMKQSDNWVAIKSFDPYFASWWRGPLSWTGEQFLKLVK